jgi:hypothetical protein
MSGADPQRTLQEILADPEFQGDWQERAGAWVEKEVHALLRWLDQLPAVYEWLLAALCLAVLVWIGVGLVAGYREMSAVREGGGPKPREGAGGAPAGLDLARRAAELRELGRLREAARTLQQAAYQALAARRGLAWDEAEADWEWVRALAGEPGVAAFTESAQALAYDRAGSAADEEKQFAQLWAQAEPWLRTAA